MADRPIAELPDAITLTRDEAAIVLFALDIVDSAVSGPEEAENGRRAVRLLTRKLWPELGDLLDNEVVSNLETDGQAHELGCAKHRGGTPAWDRRR